MNHSQLIDELIHELSYRVGIVNIYNKEQQSIMSEILTEWGEFEVKETIFNFLNEVDDERFKNPILNRKVKYIGKDGKEKEGLVGNLITAPKDSPGRIEAEKQLPKEGTPERERINQEIGSQGGGGPQDGDQGGTQQSNGEIEQNKKKFASDPSVKKQVEKEDEIRKKLEDEESTKSEEPEQTKESLLQIDHETTDKQLNMTKTEAAAQAKSKESKDVGAGTAESRAGEAMVHKGLRLLKQGKSFEDIKAEFKQLVSQKDHILNSSTGKKWVNASLATLRKIDETIGIENIEDVSWDTPQGREALGIDKNLQTSSDMFVKTKDGKNIGVSLKKDGKVFLNNGGWAKQSELLLESLHDEMPEDDHQKLSEAMSIDSYKKDLEDRFIKTTETITSDVIRQSFERLLDNEDDQKEFQGSNRSKYFKILSNPELLIKKIKLGTANGNEQKAYAKLLQTYHQDEYNYLRESDNGLTSRAFEVLNQSEEAKKGMNRHIIKSMHISETLGLNERVKDGGVDGFVTMYGIEPDGATLNEQTLITLLGSKFKQRLDETINEVRSGQIPYQQLEDFIVESIEIDYESGQILFKHESNKKYPLFKMAGRTRGIGSSPVMEMSQTPFMAHALKMGTFNTDEWDKKSLKRFEKEIIDSELDQN